MIDEGYIKFESHWQKTGPLQYVEIEVLNRWRRPLYDAGLIGYYEREGIGFGNLSIRISVDGRFIISGSQTGHIAAPGAEHYALVEKYDIGENRVWSRGATEASSESLTHAAAYSLDARIGAVVHVHSTVLWGALMNSAPTTDTNAAFGTPDMAREFLRLWRESAFAETGIAVMAGHEAGLISIGRDLQEASERILVLDRQYRD